MVSPVPMSFIFVQATILGPAGIVTYAQWRLGFIWVHKFYSHLKTQMVNQISAKDPMDISFRTIQGPSWPREECHCCQVMAVIRAVQ